MAGNLAPAFLDLFFGFRLVAQDLFLCLDESFFFQSLGGFFAFFDNLLRLILGRAYLCLGYLLAYEEPGKRADHKPDNRRNADHQYFFQNDTPP